MSRIRLDLHLHTWTSYDCLSDPEKVIRRARDQGISRIGVTDHDRLLPTLELHRRFPEEVIPGEEVRTAEGVDIIGLYLTDEIPRGTPARETCRRIREQGGIVYLPHPYAPGKGRGGRLAEELAPLADVVEVMNSRLRPMARNRRGEELARRHSRLVGAGSDAHTVGEVGRSWVEVPHHPNEPGALLEALADARVEGRTSPRWVHIASTWAKLRKKLPPTPAHHSKLEPTS